jgi:tetratricopeptide (TPR) repeat protein
MEGQEAIGRELQYLVSVVMADTQQGKAILEEVTTTNDQVAALSSSMDAQLSEIRELLVTRATHVEATRAFANAEKSSTDTGEADGVWWTQGEIVALVSEGQHEALQLLRQGDAVRAAEILRRMRQILNDALDEAPTDVTLKLLYGYFAKDSAQVYQELGQSAHADRYLALARRAFELIAAEVAGGSLTTNDAASVWNGLGNVAALAGDIDAAIAYERQAVELAPGYAHAWHDLFLDYDDKARGGIVDLEAMKYALDHLRACAPGNPGFDPDYLDELTAMFDAWHSSGPTATTDQ